MGWHAAMNYCRSRTIADLRGWRVPTSKEIRRIPRSQMPHGPLWTATPDTKDRSRAYLLGDNHVHMKIVAKQRAAGHAICVRALPPSSPPLDSE